MTFLPVANDSEAGARGLVSRGGFTAFAEWFALKDDLVPYIGERAVSLFAFAIADASNSLVTTTHLRKLLIDSGENVDSPQVTESEQLLMDWGRQIAQEPGRIPNELYVRLESTFNPRLRLLLVAFAAQTVATNVVNTVGRIPLEESMFSYRRAGDDRTV
jgi:hypothetical protein